MPDVGDGAGKQRPSLRPIDPIVVCDHATLARPRVETRVLAPPRLKPNTIWRVSHHESRELRASQQARGVFAGGCVAAQYPVLRVSFTRAPQPEGAGPGDRGWWGVWNFVLLGGPCGGFLPRPLAR